MKLIAVAIVMVWGVLASAGIVSETEPNDTMALSNSAGSVSYGDGVTGGIQPVGDRDFFNFQPTFTSGYVNVTTPLMVSLYSSGGTLITTATGSSLQLSSLTVGATYDLRINVPGDSTTIPSYTATFDSTPVPEPSGFAAVLPFVGSIFARRRRRRETL